MFIKRLNELMKEKSVSRKELTDALKIGRNQIKYWETNNTTPNSLVLKDIADYFNVTMDYLLGLTNEKSKIIPGDDLENMFTDRLNKLSEAKRQQALDYLDFLLAQQEVVQNKNQEDK